MLSQSDFLENGMSKLDLEFITMTNYNESFKGIKKIYEKDNLNDTLGEVYLKTIRNKLELQKLKNTHTLRFFSTVEEKKLTRVKKEYFVNLPKLLHMI